MKKTKYLFAILFMLVAFLAIGATSVNAKTITVENEEELINASKGIDSEINEIKLAKDITLTKSLTFHVVNDITLELNGCSLDTGTNNLTFDYGMSEYDESIGGYNFGFNSKLTIKDSSDSKAGKILTKKSIIFATYDTDSTHNEQIKKFGLTIDGGYYEIINPSANFISLFTNDYYTNGKNITVDVKVKDAVFKVSDENSLFGTTRDSGSDIKFNFNFESLKAMGYKIKLGSNKLGQMKLDNVIDPNSKAYFQELPYTTGAPVLTEANRNTLVMDFYATGGSNPYIIIKKVNGFEINNVEINETYKETPSLNSISIKNVSDTDLQIQNVTVDSSNFVVEAPSTSPTVSAGATNTDYKIKAKEGLPVGTYTATITVTDSNGNYTATVTLKVEPKQLTGLGISGLDSTWVYGETKTPTATGVDGLGTGDYKITYSKENNSSYEDMGTTLPKLVGKYKATLSITNPNYTASEASVNFEITPINTAVNVKSNDATFTYDGNEHSNNGYTVSFNGGVTGNTLSTGDTVNAVVTGKVKDVSDTADGNNKIESVTITNEAGDDVTSCYNVIKTNAGKLTVTPITTPIVVTADSDTKVYNGTELTKNTYKYTDNVLLSGDMLEAKITGSQKYVGIADNKVTDVKIMRNGKDITSNYTMGTHVNGTLKVTEATQTFTVNENVNVLVNGRLTVDEIKAQLGNIANYKIEYVSGTAGSFDSTTGFTAGTAAGKVEMKAIAPAIDKNNDGTNEYAEATKTFYINVVNKENVTISGLTDNQEFTYDGTTKTPWGTGTITVEDNKVDVNELEIFYNGTGSTTYSSKFAPVDAGTYTITYKVKDSNPNYVGSVTYAFTIKKAQLEKVTIVKDTFEYTGSDITPTLNNVNSNIEVTGDTTAKNVSNNTITAKIKDKDKDNYEWKGGSNSDLTINWSITQATPDYTVPTGLTSVKGKVLADVALPTGFTWNAPTTVLTVGKTKYKATFTPTDTTNYKTITDINIEVNVKNTFDVITSVPGGNGTITPSKIDVIEGSKVKITFTPNTGYMIDKVLVNGIEKTVTGNEIEITVDEEKTVEVSYKKIPFTITVEEVTGATVNPDGTVTVGYGDNKDFTITANTGYKLVKVLVNDVEKALDGNTLKLKNITSNMKIKVVVEKIEYKVIEGAEQTYTIKEDTEARFRIDADYSLFNNKVYVDNVLVDSSNYTSKSGSTIIVLNKDYVDTLAVGEHTLKVAFADGGEAETTFTIARKAEDNNNNEDNNENNNENNTPSKPEDKEEMKDNGSNPKTGDNIMLYVAIASMSIIGLVATTIVAKKKKMN